MNDIPINDVDEDTDAAQEEYNVSQVSELTPNKKNKMSDKKGENLNNESGKFIIVAVVAFLIGFGVGFLVFSNRSSNEDVLEGSTGDVSLDDTNTPTSTEPVEQVVVESASLSVSDQTFGNTVAIDDVVLDRTGWVVVFEDNDGAPGSILGAQLYNAGEVIDGEVSLLRGTTADSIYYVKLHSDDGDRQFDFAKDVPFLNADGTEVMTTFRTTTGTPR